VLEAGVRTADIGRINQQVVGTDEMTAAIIGALK